MKLIQSWKILSAPVVVASLYLIPGALIARDFASSSVRQELGFWMGATNPMPSTELGELLDSTITGGGFYRISWPWVFHSELGFSHATYSSRNSQKLEFTPVYGALAYQLPLPWKLQIFLKGGVGESHIRIRQENREGWEPTAYAGTELSILAGRKLRIGVRLDYLNVYEQGYNRPRSQDYANYYTLLKRPSAQPYDDRFYTTKDFKIKNGEFLNLGVMLSFFL